MRHSRGAAHGRPRSVDVIVRITGNGVTWQGQIEHVHTGQVQQFRSCLEMIILIQVKLDELGFPQGATAIRSWTAEPFHHPLKEAEMK